jgi:2-oxoglutarate dehydrogenase E1 component
MPDDHGASTLASGRSGANEALLDTLFLFGGNAAYLEELAARYAADPNSVDSSWREFFDSLDDPREAVRRAAEGPSWRRADWPPASRDEMIAALTGDGRLDGEGNVVGKTAKAADRALKIAADVKSARPELSAEAVRRATLDSIRALMMIRAYRIRGHFAADLDPLKIASFGEQPELDPETYGFGPDDLDREIYIDGVLGLETASVRAMLEILRRTYCSTLGVEFMHISSPEEKGWIQGRIEGADKGVSFTPEGKRAILRKLIETETFERFMHKRYPGTKRFGIDGGEAMVPALEQIIKRGGALGVDEIIVGMPHRGRLNVLAAVMGKPYHIIFHEFRGGDTLGASEFGSGDVKYHLGASSDREFDGNKVHLSLTANPSHLEAVNPVVLGKARAKQSFDIRENPKAGRGRVMPLLLHGDAAFAGQGVVAECFGLSGLAGHRTGGTVHFIVNNQIGFTTSPRFSRSSPYPSDVALMVQAPIFHVNGDDPEAVTYAAKVAAEYRQKFAKDVVIDMFCYRRYGHNEGDDPSFTQPLMYKKISEQPTTREVYEARLIDEGVLSAKDVESWITEFEAFLESEYEKAETYKTNKADWLDGKWSGLGLPDDDDRKGKTAFREEDLLRLGKAMTRIPKSIDCHKTLRRVIERRRETIEAGEGIDWATAEHLAFATLLDEGFPVRLSGQDSARGTFSQRHSHMVDQTTEKRWTPLNHLREGQAKYEVVDSMLSEYAVLGFEYGYSLTDPNTLVLWEAQFGDFANGAQVMIDQFICSGERKWLRMSGLVLLLPHGYEGQGPEHSSARLERFLQLCAEDNMQVVNCTSPANYFHALRRQIHREFRKPLVVMTPKSLLRHKKCVSKLAHFTNGSSFHRVLWDDADASSAIGATDLTAIRLKPDDEIRRVVLCSGKVYFDLLEEREQRGIDDVYLLRVEQYYPFPFKSLLADLQRFSRAEIVWCQEEPKNMGAWFLMEPNLEWTLAKIGAKHPRARYAGRPASASTATGLMSKHLAERAAFIDDALTDE